MLTKYDYKDVKELNNNQLIISGFYMPIIEILSLIFLISFVINLFSEYSGFS